MRHKNRTLAAAAVAGAAAIGAFAPAAQATYFDSAQLQGVCAGTDSLHGIGASGLRAALVAWGNGVLSPTQTSAPASGFGYDGAADYAACGDFKLPADGGTKVLDYRATGSGSCMTILGANGAGQRQYTETDITPNVTVTDVAYCGTEDAPTDAQLTAAEASGGPTRAEANFMTIPVAQVAESINVRLPDGCRVLSDKRNISRTDLEAAMEGTITTWGQIFHGGDMSSDAGTTAANQACRAKAFKRVVRLDSSGTTFLVKRYLQGVVDHDGGTQDWKEPSIGGTLPNTSWPNDSGATAVLRPSDNGNGPMLDLLNAQSTNGGIGYGDLATSRSKLFGWKKLGDGTYDPTDRSIWLRVQRVSSDTYNAPALANAETPASNQFGASCLSVSYTGAPSSDLGASWTATSAVPTPDDYPICGLQYIVTSLWGRDPRAGAPNPGAKVWAGSTPGEYRAMKDYLRYLTGILRPTTGPDKLQPKDYAPMPKSIRATARCQVSIIGWERASTDPAPGSAIPRGGCSLT